MKQIGSKFNKKLNYKKMKLIKKGKKNQIKIENK